MKYKYSREEQETIIRFDEADQTAHIYTFNRRLQKRMADLEERFPDEVSRYRQVGQSVSYMFPKAWVKINPPRQLSPEEKERLSKQMRNAHTASKSQ